MTPLEREYRYLVARAIRKGQRDLAQRLVDHAWKHYNLLIDLED